jgi:hypothetical protein
MLISIDTEKDSVGIDSSIVKGLIFSTCSAINAGSIQFSESYYVRGVDKNNATVFNINFQDKELAKRSYTDAKRIIEKDIQEWEELKKR